MVTNADVSGLWDYPGVTGVSVAPDGNSITVWVESATLADSIPATFMGVRTRVLVSRRPRIGEGLGGY